MIRNLLVLLGLVLLTVLGMTVYHRLSIQSIREQAVSFSYWEDRSGTSTVADARRAIGYRPLRQGRLSVGYTESVYWVRCRLAGPRELTLEVSNHTIDRLELVALQPGEPVQSLGQTGSRYPFVRRPSPNRTVAYLLNVPTHAPTDYYLRLDSRYKPLTTDLRLWNTDEYENRTQRSYFLWGIFLGVVALVVALALLFYANTHDPVYAWYGLYVLALTLRQLADSGLGFQFVWPGLPALNHPDAAITAMWLYLPAMLQFQHYFLGIQVRSPTLFRAMQGLKWTFWGLVGLLLVAQLTGFADRYTGTYRLVTAVHGLLFAATLLVFGVVVSLAIRSRDAVQQLYGIGFGLQTAGHGVVLAQGMLAARPTAEGSFVDTYLMLMVNFFIDLVIFSFLLAHRYRTSLNEQQQLQLRLAQAQRQTNDTIIDVLESERQQVGNLLQTDIGGRVAQVRTLLTDVPPAPLLTDTLTLLDKTDDCLHQILRDSLPPDLMQKGLPAALAELVAQRNQLGQVQLWCDTTGSETSTAGMSALQVRQLYRIASELLNNIGKHAQATEGYVTFSQMPTGWLLTVADNGRGFDPSAAGQAGGIGLKNLYARAQAVGATVGLESGPGGTTVRVEVPR
jgi:two-component system, sensor histidine kinase LadS